MFWLYGGDTNQGLGQMRKLFLDVWQLESVVVLLVDELQIGCKQECRNAEAGKDDERNCVVVRYELAACLLSRNDGRIVGIGTCQYAADEHWHKAETEVLYPEDKTVGTAENLLVDNLRHAWPKGCGNEGKRDAEQHNGGVGYDVAVGLRKYEGKDEVAGNEQQGTPHEHGGSLTLVVEI